MCFRCVFEISSQLRRKTTTVIVSLGLVLAIVFMETLSWRNNAVLDYQAVMCVTDALICNAERAFWSFVIPIISVSTYMILFDDDLSAIVLRRGSRINAWLVSCVKSVVMCVLFTASYLLMILALSKCLHLEQGLNWTSYQSLYFFANECVTDSFSLPWLWTVGTAYILLTMLLYVLAFQLIRFTVNSPTAALIFIFAFGINEAWGYPILARHSGIYYTKLTDDWNPLINLGLPLLLSAVIILVGCFTSARKEFLGSAEKR